MGENETGENTLKNRNKKWEMAFMARMRQNVPGLFLGNAQAPYKRDMLQANHINAIVSPTDTRWVWWDTITREAGIPEHRHKWVQCADSSTQDLLAHMSDICDFIDQMAPGLFHRYSPYYYPSSASLKRMTSKAVLPRRRY
jgi:dual specificity phosphatase 12